MGQKHVTAQVKLSRAGLIHRHVFPASAAAHPAASMEARGGSGARRSWQPRARRCHRRREPRTWREGPQRTSGGTGQVA